MIRESTPGVSRTKRKAAPGTVQPCSPARPPKRGDRGEGGSGETVVINVRRGGHACRRIGRLSLLVFSAQQAARQGAEGDVGDPFGPGQRDDIREIALFDEVELVLDMAEGAPQGSADERHDRRQILVARVGNAERGDLSLGEGQVEGLQGFAQRRLGIELMQIVEADLFQAQAAQ